MLEWNASKKILYGYQTNIARPSLIPDTSNNVTYESFTKYCNSGVYDDVMDIFMPALNRAINIEPPITTNRGRIKPKVLGKNYFNNTNTHITVRFQLAGFQDQPSIPDDVTVVEIPTVDENGIIKYEGTDYAFIHMLEQEPTVSYEGNEDNAKPSQLKIRNGIRSIIIESSSSDIKVKLSDRKGKTSQTKYTLIDLIVAMAIEEGYDPVDIFNEYANFFIINTFKDEQDKVRRLAGMVGNRGSINGIDYSADLVPRLTGTRIKENGEGDTSYDNNVIRPDLNELLSLDRAVGEILYSDVYSVLHPDVVLAYAGEVIDVNMLKMFYKEGVYNVYVKNIPDIEGYFLADDIIVNHAPAGLKITEDLREYFPNESGMYTSHAYNSMEEFITFPKGTQLTVNMLNALNAFGYDQITVSNKPKNGKLMTLRFYEEIMSNRQFRGSDIGLSADKWYYLDASKNFKEANGYYTAYDFAALQSFCVKLFEGKWIDRIVNADAGFRKVLIPLEEQYHRAFCYAVREGFRQMNRKFKEIYKSNESRMSFIDRDKIDNNFYPFTKNFWRYLRDEAKCVVRLQSDNIHNPLAYQSACTKVNTYTSNKHSIADSQRQIAIGSYGKLDAYEVPQSQKLGVVNNYCCGTKIDTDGSMRTAYYQLRHMGTKSIVNTSQKFYFTSREEEQYVIADICSLNLNEQNIVADNTQIVQCRIPTRNSIEKSTFAYRPISQVQYVNVDANQTLSWGCATIPFMSSNDAARAIFAIAQMKQAKGLCISEEPDVITSAYEQFPWLNNKYGIIAKRDGVVQTITYNRFEGTCQIHVLYGLTEAPDNTAYIANEDTDIFEFPEYFDSGSSVTKLKILVKENQTFKRGDVLVCSNFVSENGILKLGVNALVGYICDGYNYEDSSHMSRKLCDRLTSYRINKQEMVGSPKTTKAYSVKSPFATRWLSPSNNDTFAVSYKDKRFTSTMKENKPVEDAYGFYEDYETLKPDYGKGSYGAVVSCVSVDAFHEGDKSSNRHGNKSVLSVVEDNANMPRLMNGMALDVCLNPLGVGSRMNIGQVKEAHCGLIAHVGNYKISADAYNSISEDEISELMSLTVDLMNSGGAFDGVFAAHSNLFNNMKNGEAFKQHLIANAKHITIYAGCFNKRGTTKVMLPTNDGRVTETEILIGYIHIFKLIQESHKKIHARGGQNVETRYSSVADAPTHGASNEGGQRFGTMEIDALCAYGTSAYIEELTNERCDNAIARDNFEVNTYLPGRLKNTYNIKSLGQRRAVTQFLYSMLALGVVCEPNDGEFVPLNSDNAVKLAHWKRSALQDAATHYVPKAIAKPVVKQITSTDELEIPMPTPIKKEPTSEPEIKDYDVKITDTSKHDSLLNIARNISGGSKVEVTEKNDKETQSARDLILGNL